MFKTCDGMIRVISATAAVTAMTIGGIAVAPMLSGCSAISQLDKKGVAATFDGGEITEDEVNSYIADYRKAQVLEEKIAWHGYLKQSGATASSMRRTAIDTLEERKVIENEAGKRGIDVKKSDIDGKIKELRDYYGYDKDGWRQQLKTLGYTESGYRAYIKDSLLRERLMQKAIKVSEAKDSDVISLANDYTGSIDGAKRLSVITFDDSSEAGSCADSIASGETTFEKAKKKNGGCSTACAASRGRFAASRPCWKMMPIATIFCSSRRLPAQQSTHLTANCWGIISVAAWFATCTMERMRWSMS